MDPYSNINCIIMSLIMIILGLLGLKAKSKLYKDDLAITVLAQLCLILGLAGFIVTIIFSKLPIW